MQLVGCIVESEPRRPPLCLHASATMLLRLSAATLMLLALDACARAPERHDGPPARLVAGATDTVVVNEYLATRLPIHPVDAAGHELPANGVRYRWLAGDSLPVSAFGIVTCSRPADALVRASLGSLERRFHLLCRPVHKLLTSWMLDLVAG